MESGSEIDTETDKEFKSETDSLDNNSESYYIQIDRLDRNKKGLKHKLVHDRNQTLY